MDREERIIAVVEKKIDDYKHMCGIGFMMHCANLESRDHIARIGARILIAKWSIGPPTGSCFVQAVADNNLTEAFGRADSINTDSLKFYSMLIYNTAYIE